MTPDRSLLVLARDALAPLANASTPIERETLTDADNERAAAALAALDAQLSQPEVPVTPRDSLLAEADILASEHPSKDVRWFADSVARYLRAQPEALGGSDADYCRFAQWAERKFEVPALRENGRWLHGPMNEAWDTWIAATQGARNE